MMKSKVVLTGILSLVLVFGMVFVGCDTGNDTPEANDPNVNGGGNNGSGEPVIETFPEDAVSGTGTSRVYSLYGGGYGCAFTNKSSQKIYVKAGEVVKSISPNGEESFDDLTTSSRLSFVYAPADLVQLASNDYSEVGEVKFVNMSVTTGTITITNTLKVNNTGYRIKKITITDVTNPASPVVYKTDTTSLDVQGERTYTVPGGKNYEVAVIWAYRESDSSNSNSGTSVELGSPGYISLPNGGEATLLWRVSTTSSPVSYYFTYLLE